MDKPLNYWSEFEYDKLKLLLHKEKVQSLIDVYKGDKGYDELPPISVEMHLTDKCNLNCPWCTDKDQKEIGATLPQEKIKELMDVFGSFGTGVTLEGGGEPTIHPDFKNIVKYGKECGVHMGLITNGTMDISEVLNDLRWIRISLDSSNPEEYKIEKGGQMFERVFANIAKYREIRDPRNCYLGIGYVLTNRNYSSIDEVVEKLDDLGVDYIYFRPVEEAPEISPTRSELYALRQRLLSLTENRRIKFILTINDRLEDKNVGLPCVAHAMTSIIHADGNVALCEKRRHDTILIGNIYESDFKSIWNDKIRKEASKKLLDYKNQGGCSVCRITPFNRIIHNLIGLNTGRFI